MNWINLLYPRPSIEVAMGPKWLGMLHQRVKILAYYLTHTLALVCLSFIYFVLILPMKAWAVIKGQDLLEEKIEAQRKSYFRKSEDLANLNFTRMY